MLLFNIFFILIKKSNYRIYQLFKWVVKLAKHASRKICPNIDN